MDEPQPKDFSKAEADIPGQGFSQFDPKTGWLWIGIKPQSFSRDTAWAFIQSQKFMFFHLYDQLMAELQKRTTLAQATHGRPGAIQKLINGITGKH